MAATFQTSFPVIEFWVLYFELFLLQSEMSRPSMATIMHIFSKNTLSMKIRLLTNSRFREWSLFMGWGAGEKGGRKISVQVVEREGKIALCTCTQSNKKKLHSTPVPVKKKS